MRLDFNVLWVEDNQQYVQSQRERIELLMNKEGFRLQVQFASSIEEAKEYLSDDIYGDHIDLVLMDYDLGTGGRGDDGLVEVRSIFLYKDIIFYSAQSQDLADLVAQKKIEGVYCSTRDDLPDTVTGVFEVLVKKVLDIDHSRGIVMGATSDIDQYVNDCLISIFDTSDDTCRDSILKVLAKHLKGKRKNFNKEVELIEATRHVSELFDKHNIYTSNDRLRLLKNAVRFNKVYIEQDRIIEKYIKETVPRRNLLAHVRVETNGFSRKLFNKNGEELTSEDMRTLRKELLEFQDAIEKLSSALSGPITD